MVQVLPAVPSFGEKLATVLGQAGGNIGQHFVQRHQDQKDQEIINSFDPNASPIDQIKKFSQLSSQKQTSLTPLLQQYLKTQGTQQVAQQKQEAEALKKQEESAGLKNALDFLDENVEYTGTKYIPGFKSFTAGGLKRDVVEKRAEIDSTGFLAADQIFTHFNKGTISKDKLKVIQNDLAPKSNLSERENKARINALRRMANLPPDISPDKFNKILDKEVKAAKKGGTKPSIEEILQ